MFFRCTLPSGKVLVRFNDYTHYFFPSNNFLGKRLRNQPHPNFILDEVLQFHYYLHIIYKKTKASVIL